MNNSFTENDWKLFRYKILAWQESYMTKLLSDYSELLNGNASSSEKFRELENRINRDKKHSGVMIEMRRSLLIQNLVMLIQDKVIEVSDLKEFSDELQEAVRIFLEV